MPSHHLSRTVAFQPCTRVKTDAKPPAGLFLFFVCPFHHVPVHHKLYTVTKVQKEQKGELSSWQDIWVSKKQHYRQGLHVLCEDCGGSQNRTKPEMSHSHFMRNTRALKKKLCLLQADCFTQGCYTLLLSPTVALRPHNRDIFVPPWPEALCFRVVHQSICPSHCCEGNMSVQRNLNFLKCDTNILQLMHTAIRICVLTNMHVNCKVSGWWKHNYSVVILVTVC